ncbi:MAG TPA: DUF1071 domain-containing protein [Candidatus Angelobacter sp.]|jgi:hypothetical protein|nr:DUF1071 domain-containing protein [Candidatus Angelobacter sp.]
MNSPERIQSSFERLASINVNAKLEKKNGLSYLSWAWAWDQLLRVDPEADFEYGQPTTHAGETVMVYCTVTAFGKKRTAHLPVMDHRNKAIAQPDAFQINTAMQRCLVKAIGLHGLGLYIYAGEDLPEGETAPQESGANPTAIARENFEKLPAVEKEPMRMFAADIVALVDDSRADEAYHMIENKNFDDLRKPALWSLLDSKTRSALKRVGDQRRAA